MWARLTANCLMCQKSKSMKKYVILIFLLVSGLFAAPASSIGNGSACFKHRDVMYGGAELFEALKKTLLQSNFNIVTISKENGVIFAKGDQYNEDTITEITVSISFKEINAYKSTISMIAGYNVLEKKLNTGQIGFSGVSLPIPVPLTGRYAMVGSGHIDESSWFIGFYNSLDKVYFEDAMIAK